MPMDSGKLSRRDKQPGDDQTYRESETNFIRAARSCLDAVTYDVVEKPNELRNLFPSLEPLGTDYGIVPEAAIVNKITGRRFFVEVKKQGEQGNADERACKHHTVQFYKVLHEKYRYDYHPFVTVFCEALSYHPRYTQKARYYFEKDNYFLWQDYDLDYLCKFLTGRCASWLD